MDKKEKDITNPTDQSKNQSDGVKIAFKPSDEANEPFVVKKTPQQIKIEEASATQTSRLDINSNLGSFGNDDVMPTVSVSVLEKIEEKQIEDKKKPKEIQEEAKIDFAKFDKRKSNRSQTKLGIKLDMWLRQPKSLLIIWLTAIAIIVLLWASQITYVVIVSGILKNTAGGGSQTLNYYHNCAIAGNILSYISIGLPLLPFFFLLTAAIIGINGMLSSRTFHYFLWSLLIIAFVCFIASTTLASTVMVDAGAFTHPQSY